MSPQDIAMQQALLLHGLMTGGPIILALALACWAWEKETK